MKWWKQHLTTRLSGYFLLLSLVSVGITGGITFYRAQAALQRSVFDQLSVTTTLKENEISRWFEDQQRIFLSIAQLPIVNSQSLILLNPATNQMDRAAAHSLLTKYLDSLDVKQGSFTEVLILDRSDRVIVSTDKTHEGEYQSSADLTYFEEIQPGEPATPIFYTSSDSKDSNKLIVTFATPLRGKKGERLGVVIAHLNLARLSQIVKAQTELGQGVDAYLVGSVGATNTLVSNTLNNRLGEAVSSAGIDAAMRGVNGSSLYPNYGRVPVVGVYHSLSHLGLALLVEREQTIANAPAVHLAQQIMLMGLISAGALSLCLYWLSRRIAHPILAIADTATQVAQGNLNQQAPVLTTDEVGVLAKNFNYMIEQLKISREKSEQYSRSLEQKAQELQITLKELNSTQAQLVQNEKMSSLGQLVAGVAHEINNPVNFIHGNLGYLEEYTHDLVKIAQTCQHSCPHSSQALQGTPDNSELEFLIEDVVKILRSMKVGTDRIREIVLSLRNFSRLDEAEFKAVDIHEGIDSTLMILHHRLKAKAERPEIKIVKQYSRLPLVKCYPGQLNQVFMNLLANAIDALEESNQEYSFQEIAANPNEIQIQTQMIDPSWIRIIIADNGIGIPEEARLRLFDPFFTTKPVGKGTGLGLSISYQIVVDKHNGRFSCDSVPGKGTKFVIEIPVMQR
jgi:two-component system NtrC family sensor kinase